MFPSNLTDQFLDLEVTPVRQRDRRYFPALIGEAQAFIP
jgi:hypothetical protein